MPSKLTLAAALLLVPRLAGAFDLTLELVGAADGIASTEIKDVVGNSGVVDFGTSSTLMGTQSPGAGERVRLDTGGPGSHFVATFVVTATITGGTGSERSTIVVQRVLGALPEGRLKYADGTALDRGAPIHLVHATLGHATVSTTGRYLHARPKDSSSRFLAL